jgi:predicted amidophosphoribosyltransferase
MYCSSCGSVVAQGLSYCNHCGAKLSRAKSESVAKSSELFPDSLVWATVSVFIIGLGCIIGLVAVMKDLLNFNNGIILTIMLLSFLLMFMVEGVFIWLLLSRRRGAQEVGDAERSRETVTKELGASQARALAEPASSITEHATRKFEPSYSERKTD